MKQCFMFQWGVCCSDRGLHFLSVGGRRGAHGGVSVLVGEGVSRKIVRWGVPPMAPLWETLKRITSQSKAIVLY